MDIIVRNARIIDGTGAPARRGDVGIRNGRIAVIGDLAGADAERIVDACGHAVAPGFIDLHTHCTANPTENYLQQGVTSVVGGNCGFSDFDPGPTIERCAVGKAGPNIAMLVGHNTIRRHVVGSDDRPATPEEMDAMRALVSRAMEKGAVGFSAGLAYIPGVYTETEEIVELARAAALYGGYYVSHMRNESAGVLEAVEETIRIGCESGLPAHISHHKVAGTRYHGNSARTLDLIERSRAAGMDVTLDQYPYTASCGRIGLLFPEWCQAGDDRAIGARLSDPETAARIEGDIEVRIEERFAGDPVRIAIASCARDPSIEGKTIARLAAERGRGETIADAVTTIMEIARLDNPANAGTMCVYHTMSEEDVRRIMVYPHTSIASDGWGADRRVGTPHPRLYGTFPRVLGRYSRELGLFPLEEAVRKMTSLPAARLGITDRGVLKEGAWADITMFDPDTVADEATFDHPTRPPAGIDLVMVNGVVVVDHGEYTGACPGSFLSRPYPVRPKDC